MNLFDVPQYKVQNLVITSDAQLLSLKDKFNDYNYIVGFDYETTGLFAPTCKVVSLQVAFKVNDQILGIHIPLSHKEGPNVSREAFIDFLDFLFTKKIVAHNALFEVEMTVTNFNRHLPLYADTMVMAASIGEEDKSLKGLIAKYYNTDTEDFSSFLSRKLHKQWKSKKMTCADLPPAVLAEYAIKDPIYTIELFEILKPQVVEAGAQSIFKLEMNIIPIIAKVNLLKRPIDVKMLDIAHEKAQQEQFQLLNDMKEIVGHDFKPFSVRDVNKILFEELQLPVLKTSKKTGAPSADKEVLAELATLNPFPDKLVKYRAGNRMVKAYLEGISNIVRKQGGMYASFAPLGADSGRMSCPSVSDADQDDCTVNMQNQPKGKAVDIRKAYPAPEGFYMVSCDYSQMELRVMANLAGEQFLIDSFNNGIDMHTATARLMLNIPEDQEVTKEQRAMGKVFNFGVSYGMSFTTVAKDAKISEEEAEQKYNYFFSKVPKLKALIDYCYQFAYDNKYISTAFGRRRKLDWEKLPARPVSLRRDFLKKAFNTRIQGTSADLCKMAILRLDRMVLQKYPEDTKLTCLVHDEVVLWVRKDKADEIFPLIVKAMQVPVPNGWCEMTADLAYGPTWSANDLKDWEPEQPVHSEHFTSWKAVLPDDVHSLFEDEDYVIKW